MAFLRAAVSPLRVARRVPFLLEGAPGSVGASVSAACGTNSAALFSPGGGSSGAACWSTEHTRTHTRLAGARVTHAFRFRREKLKIILCEDFPHLGFKGEVVSVAPGYAKYKLFPKGIAVYATDENLSYYSSDELRQAAKATRKQDLVSKAIGSLRDKSFAIKGHGLVVGGRPVLERAVTRDDIEYMLERKKLHVESLELPNGLDIITEAGVYNVMAHMYGEDVAFKLRVHLIPMESVLEEEPASADDTDLTSVKAPNAEEIAASTVFL